MTDISATPEMLVEISDRIRARTAQAVIETGRDLIKAKELLVHGGFGDWLRSQVGIEPKTAQRYMQVARWADSLPKDKNDNLSLLPTSALYNLSAKSTSEPACEAVLKALEKGKRLNVANVRTLICRNYASEDSARLAVDSAVTSTAAAEAVAPYQESGEIVEVLPPETAPQSAPEDPLRKPRKPTKAQLEQQ